MSSPSRDVVGAAPTSHRVFSAVGRDERLSDKVAAQIRETILAREFQPGDRLPSERELGDQFGVSRTVIREAIRSLHAKGLVASTGRGNRVAEVTTDNVRETMGLYLQGSPVSYEKVHEIRVTVEVEVAGLAADRASKSDLLRLKQILQEHAQSSDDPDRAASLDLEFHQAIADATQNELYRVVLDAISDALLAARQTTSRITGRIAKGVSAHQKILDRIVARDAVGARATMARHLQESLRLWSRITKDGTP